MSFCSTIGVVATGVAVMVSASAAAPDVRSTPIVLVASGSSVDAAPVYRATLGDRAARPVAGTRGVTEVFEGSATHALASRGGELLRVPLRRTERVTRLATLPGRPDVVVPSQDATHAAAGIWCEEANRALRVFGVYHVDRGVQRLPVTITQPKAQALSIIPLAFDPRSAHLAVTLQTWDECRGPAITSSQLLVLDVARSTSRLLEDAGVESNVAFSPDGGRLAYVTGSVEVKVVSLRTGRVRVIDRRKGAGRAAAACCSVAWGNGRLIYAIEHDVYSRPSGGGPRLHHGRLTEGPSGMGGGALIVGVSRSGDRFAYVSAHIPRYVYVARVDGGRTQRYRLPSGSGPPDWPSIRVSLD